jgi:NIMA (never in mitosis gene a)-related kinase
MEGLFKKVVRGFYSRIPNEYSNELHTAIKQLLEVNPNLRPACGINQVM